MANYIERPRFTCALGGAIAAAGALPGTIPILHAPPGCAGNTAWTQAGGCGLQVGGYCGGLSMPGTNVQEREVVFGGAERLDEQIRTTLEVMNGDLFFVLTSCVTEVIGDDVRAAVNKFRTAGVNIIHAETGGFKGNSYLGYDLVLESIWSQLVPVSGQAVRNRVNLWGIPPFYDVFWRGNLAGLRQLLAELNLEVNTFFTDDDSLSGIRQAGTAALNIVVSDIYGQTAARLSQEKHGIPYLSLPLPVGPSASGEFIRSVGDALNLDQTLVETTLKRLNRHYYRLLEPITDCFNDMDLQRYAAVIGDANYAFAVSRFLVEDLGWLPKVAVVTDPLQEDDRQRLTGRFAALPPGLQPELIFASDTNTIRHLLKEYWNAKQTGGKYADPLTPAFVVGSSLDRELAKEINAPHLSVAFPVANRAVINRGYSGYCGGLQLTEDLLSIIVAGR